MVSPHSTMETINEGPWRGQYNRRMRYEVEMGSQVLPIGSYYLLDDTKVKVQYQGNTSTCARCHQFPADCPGAGKTRDFGTSDGPRVALFNHMKRVRARLEA